MKKELTVEPRDTFCAGGNTSSFSCYQESETYLYTPKIFGLKRFGAPDKDDTQPFDEVDTPFNGGLRDYQDVAVDDFLKSATNDTKRGGMLCLYPGAGKTTCALYIVSKLRAKTLVVVHKDFLLQQWKDRIKEYLPNATIGIIKGPKVVTRGCDIVLGSLQSLSMRAYPKDTFDGFGFVIVDECHHIGAEVFSRALHHMNFRYSLGLSATPTRKDGLTKVIKWFMGDIVHKGKKRIDAVDVNVCSYTSRDPAYSTEHAMFNGKPNISLLITSVSVHAPRVEFLASVVGKLKANEPGRNVLILSDRRAHLTAMHAALTNLEGITKVGYYVGGMKEPALRNTEETCDILLATYSMAAEGMDIPKLDTLVFATPKSDVEQAIGRIQRKRPEDRQFHPLVIDVVDSHSVFCRQAEKRKKFYTKMGYTILSSSDATATATATALNGFACFHIQ
jgi:superfamily II DNA or RNA helicase